MNVFKTIAAVVPQGMDPYEFQAEAQQVSAIDGEPTCGFLSEWTSDPDGAPPPTHFLASGFIPEEAAAAMAADTRFLLSEEKWPIAVAQWNITRVVPLE